MKHSEINRICDEVLERREEILRLAEKHGAENVRVFGSAARGELGPESDIDFLIAEGDGKTQLFPCGLIVDLERLFGRKIDVVQEDALDEILERSILAEAVEI
ncbi:MAG: nucleotidyltransferase domain-containing protein [bacterium]|jgi:hypothetical protein